jgi:hypothetical protein
MWHQTAMKLKEQYSKVSVGRLCSLFGKTRHAFYDKLWYELNKISHEQIVVEMLMEIQRDMPGAGIPTIYELLRKPLLSHSIKMGRDAIQKLRSTMLCLGMPEQVVRKISGMHRAQKNFIATFCGLKPIRTRKWKEYLKS